MRTTRRIHKSLMIRHFCYSHAPAILNFLPIFFPETCLAQWQRHLLKGRLPEDNPNLFCVGGDSGREGVPFLTNDNTAI